MTLEAIIINKVYYWDYLKKVLYDELRDLGYETQDITDTLTHLVNTRKIIETPDTVLTWNNQGES